ncbi:NAD(P)-binding domain-containing protein [Streptomyces griseosporeus]
MNEPPEQRVMIVGSGPYGLATAAHLKGWGVPFRIFGEPMDGWRSHMPSRMYLKSSPFSSSISSPAPGRRLQDFRAERGRAPGGEREPVPVSEFIQYGLWFQERTVPELERVTVRRIDRAPGGAFRLLLDSGEECTARAVVLAVGILRFAHVPPELAPLVADGLVSHTADHVDFTAFAGKRVAVVGAGQSALESAALLYEAGARPTLLARGACLVFGSPPQADRPAERPLRERALSPHSLLGDGWQLVACTKGPAVYRHLPDRVRGRLLHTVLGPYGAWWLRDRIDGHFPVRCGVRVREAAPDGTGVRLRLTEPDGSTRELEADHVIAGTGYQVDIGRLELLSPELRRQVVTADGAPRLSAGFESSVSGLYFTGLAAAPTFGPLLRFVSGTAFAARRVSAAAARRVQP